MILSPRSLRPLYNPRTIVDAFELLADELPDIQLVLKHMGTDRPPVGAAAVPRPRAHRRPRALRADGRLVPGVDVCVSIASSDSSPRSVWEAVASGTPCVVSDLPWVHELIVSGRDALVVPIDPEPVAAAMRAILDDPALAQALARNGRQLVEAHHDQKREMDHVAESYRVLVTEGARQLRLSQGDPAAATLPACVARPRNRHRGDDAGEADARRPARGDRTRRPARHSMSARSSASSGRHWGRGTPPNTPASAARSAAPGRWRRRPAGERRRLLARAAAASRRARAAAAAPADQVGRWDPQRIPFPTYAINVS